MATELRGLLILEVGGTGVDLCEYPGCTRLVGQLLWLWRGLADDVHLQGGQDQSEEGWFLGTQVSSA